MKKVAQAFTLVEVMIATVVIGISFTAIFGLYSNLMRSIFSSHEIIERIILAKNMFVSADHDKLYEKDQETVKKIDRPNSTLTYTVSKPSSEIGNKFPNNKTEKVKISWPSIFGNRELQFISFRFIGSPEEAT